MTRPTAAPAESTRWVLAGAAGAGLALATSAALVAWGPAEGVCLFRRVTGVAGPLCGLTRAAAALGRGELAASLALHPFAALFALEALLLWVLAHPRARRPAWLTPPVALAANGVGLVTLWLARLGTGTLP